MKSKYEIWLSVNENKTRFQLPVNPPSLDISAASQNATVNVSGLGEVTILKEPGAKVFEFSSIFPSAYGPYCETNKIPKPWDAVAFIEKYKSTQPFRFIITNTPINLLVSVEDFKYNEKAGDVGTLSYSLKLKEYKPVKPRQVSVTVKKQSSSSTKEQVVVSKPPRPNTKAVQKTYTVVAGDYLVKIARKLGISDWRTIYNANTDKIKDPNVIKAGWVLKIP